MAKRRKRKRRAKKTAATKPSASWLDHTRPLPGTLDEILKLTPAQFEEGVADLLQHLDYRSVQRVGRSGDSGVDITCQDNEGRSVVVQCKKYDPESRKIGSPDIRNFFGGMQSVEYKADKGLFVTTSEFTGDAQGFAKNNDITLIDGKELLNLIRQAYLDEMATPDAGEAATDTRREIGKIARGPSPHLTRGRHPGQFWEEKSRANQRIMTVRGIGTFARLGDLRVKFSKLIPIALENYANRPHDPERVVVGSLPGDIFTRRRSDVRQWLQEALDDLHWERHVVLFVPTMSEAGEVVPEGVRVPRLEVRTEWKRVHEGVRSNTLLVWLEEAPEVELKPQPGAISFDAL